MSMPCRAALAVPAGPSARWAPVVAAGLSVLVLVVAVVLVVVAPVVVAPVVVAVAHAVGLGGDPAGALVDVAQASTSAPEAQDVAGDGALRYRVLAVALFVLSLLLVGLALVYWRVTAPPSKRIGRS